MYVHWHMQCFQLVVHDNLNMGLEASVAIWPTITTKFKFSCSDKTFENEGAFDNPQEVLPS